LPNAKIPNEPVTLRSAWQGADFKGNQSWIDIWSQPELDDLDRALAKVHAAGIPWHQIDRQQFELPIAGARLKRIADELENGRGFVLLRGFPVEEYSLKDARTIYWGIGSHLGHGVVQNNKGHLIASVKDQGIDYNNPNARGYVSRNRLTPHCDPTDVVGLLCYRRPLSGGVSTIASSMAIFNKILDEHPDYLNYVFQGYRYNLRGEGATGNIDEVTNHPIPVYSYFDDRLSCRFNGNMIKTAQDITGMPLSDEELKVINYIEGLAVSDEFRLDMTLELGDMQFLCNHSILHTRSEFVDGESDDQKRHLLRLWLNLHEGRDLEPDFANRYNTGPRGGCAIMVPPEQREYAS
jgi:hypothetical protein